MNNFTGIKELLSALKREEKLLSEMFGKRKSIDYKYADAAELVDYDENRLDYLLEKGVIHENDALLELDEHYLHFFEQVLAVNEEINLSYIDENIKSIKENIDYFLNETNANRKHTYLKSIKKTFRRIGLTTYRSVIDLRRHVENTFKNEPNYKNKQLKLENLDGKRELVKSLIDQTLQLTDEEEHTFFNRALDSELKQIITDLKFRLNECSHNLIETEKQIIDYLNQINRQGAFIEKLRKLKYLKDHFTIEAETDIQQVLAQRHQVIFEKRFNEPLKLSLENLRNEERAFKAIKRLAKTHKNRKLNTPVLADQISGEYLENAVEEEVMIDFEAVKNQFVATGQDLFSFIVNYYFHKPVDFNERITIFCQLAAQFEREMVIKDGHNVQNGIEYALIYPK